MAGLFSKDFGECLRDNELFEFSHIRPFYEQIKRKKGSWDMDIRGSEVAKLLRDCNFSPRYLEEVNNLEDRAWKKGNILTDVKDLLKTTATPTSNRLNSIVKRDEHARWLVLFGERLGGYLTITEVSTSQIRNAYGLVKNLDLKLSTNSDNDEINPSDLRHIMLLKPRLAYAAKREGGGMNQLSEILGQAIHNFVKTAGDFSRFSQFFEAILAYHKAYGGK